MSYYDGVQILTVLLFKANDLPIYSLIFPFSYMSTNEQCHNDRVIQSFIMHEMGVRWSPIACKHVYTNDQDATGTILMNLVGNMLGKAFYIYLISEISDITGVTKLVKNVAGETKKKIGDKKTTQKKRYRSAKARKSRTS